MRYLGLLCLVLIAFATSQAKAQDNAILARGDAVVTGFSGTKPAEPPPAAGNPIDETFIDLDGASARIMRLAPGAPPAGQLITAPTVLQVKARDVGQVFAIGLDDRILPDLVQGTPNIYLGATSAFGLQIVAPDSDGDGRPERLKKGDAQAEWMAGQFGQNGGPGSIYKVDGKTGAVSLFATIQGNSGPGLGDIVYDSATRQFFVSDLDTGLIHRLDATGALIDSFDHGQTGRPAAGLPAVADDGVAMDIKSPAFDSEDSSTWGITQPERRVWGLGLRAGRLYYAPLVGAAGPEIWSVSINLDGTFGSDPRREIEVSGTPGNHPISDVAFDAQDYMYVAQRGGIKGSYDYSVFADSKQSVVFRFGREIPDDPDTPGIWVPIPDEYAIGYPPDYRNTSGGVALGYGYDAAGAIRPGACDITIWATGDALLSNASPTQEAATEQSPVVNGLQGTDRTLTRPDNEPPATSYFVDYDGVAGDPRELGHVGDVEIWQPCAPGADFGTYAPAADLPPDYVPPGEIPEVGVPPDYLPPGYVPPGYVPPENLPPGGFPEGAYNLRLEKRALPGACVAGGLGFLCDYIVRVTNTGLDAYVGPIVVNDELPAAPAGAVMTLANIPPWICFAISPTEQQCTYGAAGLLPGESIDLHVTVDLPVAAPVCHLDNEAGLVWPIGLGDVDPADDFDHATATIPAPHCPPPDGEKTNLKISKHKIGDVCTDKIGHFECKYNIVVRNIGAGVYNGLIKVDDTIPAGATATFAPASWNCVGPAPTYSCQRGPLVLLPNQAVNLNAVVKVPKNLAGPLQCQAKNEVKIVAAAGGTDQNTDPTDDEADATMLLPGELAQCPNLDALSNLKLKKTGPAGECPVVFGNWLCEFKVTVQNFGKPYTSPVQFIDALPFGNPAGATLLFQPPPGWNCGGPILFPNLYQCSSDNPDLAHMEKVEIPMTVKIPVAPVAKCEVTNNAQIVKALGGTLLNSFAGDDASSAKAQLAAAVAQGICLSNLKLTKTGPAEPCPVAGNSWECKFKVTLQNFGKDYKSPIQFVDALPGMPAGSTVSFQPPAGWNCGALLPNLHQCSSNNPNLTHNEKVEIPVTVRIPVAPVAKCEITNNAVIVKAPGGTGNNFFKNDDDDSAKAQLAGVFKQGQFICLSANLKLEMTRAKGIECPVANGSWVCDFILNVTNLGDDPYRSEIQLLDALPPGSPADATMTFQEPPGWDCGGPILAANIYQCRSKNPDLAKGESVAIPVSVRIPVKAAGQCYIVNKGLIVKAPGGTPLNTNKDDDASWAAMKFKKDVPLPIGQVACPSPKQSNLKIEKTSWVPGEDWCRISGNIWLCDWKVKITNLGDTYTLPLAFDDRLEGVQPAGASVMLSQPPGWECKQLGQDRAACRSDNPNLAKGESVEFAATVRVPLGPVETCTVTNRARITALDGGPNLSPGSHESSATLKMFPYVPAGYPDVPAACLLSQTGETGLPLATPEGKESNLSITKTASASQVTATGQSSKFTITVTNQGPGVFNAPIEVRDTLFDGQIVEPSNGSWPLPWVCEGEGANGHPEQGICKHPQIALDPGESVVLELEIEAPNSFIAPSGSQVKCGYKNKAEILRPAPGSPKNNDASDDVAFADVKFAPFELHGKKFCEPGLTSDPGRDRNLTITKTVGACDGTASGQNCPFTITVTNAGPGVHNGPIELRDTLFDGQIVEPSNGSWSFPWVCEGQSAFGHPEQGICTHPPVQLDPGESVVLTLEIEAPNSFVAPSGSQVRCGYTNQVEILKPAGGTPQNTNAGDDTGLAEAKFEPFEKHGTTFCGLGLTTPPASQACPQGWSRTPLPGKCCPPRSSWDGERCTRDVKQPEEKCPANSVGDYPDCRCKSGFTGTPPDCLKIDVDVPEKCTGGMERIDGECRCPRGTRFIDGKCRTPSSGPEKTCDVNEVGTYPNCRCAKGFTGAPPNCRPIVCPPGTRGKFPDCRKIDCPANQEWIDGACRCRYPLKWNGKRCVADTPKVCPADSVGNYPNCRCKRGTTGVPGKCERIVIEPKKCPADSVGNFPNCRCKRGTTGTPGKCQRIVEPKKCPADSVGSFPNCRCKRGTTGTPGKCERIVIEPKKCPKGFRGTPPNCVRIVIEPKRCPKGFRGTPPDCKRIVIEPRTCPKGFRGTPPNCVRIIIDAPRRLCPPGFRGTPPNCKRVGTNPQ